MPTKKWHLNATEQQRHLDNLRRLKAAKCQVEIPEEGIRPKEKRLLLQQIGHEFSSVLYDLPGTVFLVIPLRLVTRSAGITICDCEIELAHGGHALCLSDLGDLEEAGLRLPELRTKKLEVLTPWFEGRKLQRSGEVHEGWIIAQGMSSLPKQYQHVASISGKISVKDQNENVTSLNVRLSVDRSAVHQYERNRESLRASRRIGSEGLFARDAAAPSKNGPAHAEDHRKGDANAGNKFSDLGAETDGSKPN